MHNDLIEDWTTLRNVPFHPCNYVSKGNTHHFNRNNPGVRALIILLVDFLKKDT